MKNRNYLIFGSLMAIVLGIILVRFTTETNIGLIPWYSDIGALFFGIIFSCFVFYIIAFSDFNQVSSARLTKYKLRWLIDISIFSGLATIFTSAVCIRLDVGPAENWVKFIGNIWHTLALQFHLNISSNETVDWENIPLALQMGGSMAIHFSKLLYAFLLSFSFYLLSFFIKDQHNPDPIKPGKRTYILTFALIYIVIVRLVDMCINLNGRNMSMVNFFNEYVFLSLFGIVLFYYFQPGTSLSMLIKNLVCDCDEGPNSIKGQLQGIMRTKRVIMCLCFIGIMFIPTAIFGGLAYHTEDSMGILHILYNATLLIYWGIVLLLFLTALEGKYNFKLFHQNGSMIEDKMFLPKFVAPPFMLYFLLAVILFVLFNVLF